jgi:hypothetical protein
MTFLGFLLFVLHTEVTSVEASPCCAQASGVPALITGDERINLGFGFSNGTVIGDAPAAGGGVPVFRDSLSPRESRTLGVINAATLLDGDRLQAGISMPFQWNRISSGRTESSHMAPGDLSLTLGHESLPEWEYSLWKPRGFSFFQLTLPTGRSIHESADASAGDVTGSGQVALSMGFVALKRWSVWDAQAMVRFGRLFAKNFDSGIRVGSGWSGGGSVGGGFSFRERFRLGGNLGVEALTAVPVRGGGVESGGAARLVWTAGAQLSWLQGDEDTWIVGYADQTLFGPALNTTLARTFSLSFMHRIER